MKRAVVVIALWGFVGWVVYSLLFTTEFASLGAQGEMKFVSLDGADPSDPDVYERIPSEWCAADANCFVWVFEGTEDVSIPFSDAMLDRRRGQYIRNAQQPDGRWLFWCGLAFVDARDGDCFNSQI